MNEFREAVKLENRLTTIESLLKTILAALSFIICSILWLIGQVATNSRHRNESTDVPKRLAMLEKDVVGFRTYIRVLAALVTGLLGLAAPVIIWYLQRSF